MKHLSKRQHEVFLAVFKHWQERNPATITTLADELGILTPTGVHYHLRILEDAGWLLRPDAMHTAWRPSPEAIEELAPELNTVWIVEECEANHTPTLRGIFRDESAAKAVASARNDSNRYWGITFRVVPWTMDAEQCPACFGSGLKRVNPAEDCALCKRTGYLKGGRDD